MACERTNSRFVITRGVDNTFVFTIKKNASTLPIKIDNADTFVASIRNKSDGVVVMTKNLSVENALGGQVALTISSTEANTLLPARGGEEDRYYLKPKYSIIIECNTVANGEFIAKVDSVYVD